MALKTLTTNANGNSGASASVPVAAGATFIQVTATSFTSCNVAIQFSDDNTTFVTIGNITANNTGQLHNLPEGFLRVNLTGGSTGEAINTKYKQFSLKALFVGDFSNNDVIYGQTNA